MSSDASAAGLLLYSNFRTCWRRLYWKVRTSKFGP